MVYQLESSRNRPFLNNEANWTATYRRDSTISTPYGRWEEVEGQGQDPTLEDLVSGREGRVAWFVSNCDANNKRLEYGRALARHFPVDIIGKCGSREVKCSRVRSGTLRGLLTIELVCRANRRNAGGWWEGNISFTSPSKTVTVSTTFLRSSGRL